MSYTDFRTYTLSLDYGGSGGRRLSFAPILRDNLKGKSLNDPDAQKYKALIESHDHIPIIYQGRIIPSWAILDFYKLSEQNPANRELILRTDRIERVKEYGRDSEEYAAAMRGSLAPSEIPPLHEVLARVNQLPLESRLKREGARAA